jgi:hypothetical protein
MGCYMTDNADKKYEFSIIKINADLTQISKPFEKLIDSVSRGLGLLYEPYRMRKSAQALSDAMNMLKIDEPDKKKIVSSFNRKINLSRNEISRQLRIYYPRSC